MADTEAETIETTAERTCQQDGTRKDANGGEHYFNCGEPGEVDVAGTLMCEHHAGELGYGPKQEEYGYDPEDGLNPAAGVTSLGGLEDLVGLLCVRIGAWEHFGYADPPTPDCATIPPLAERSDDAFEAGCGAVEVIDELIRDLRALRGRLTADLTQAAAAVVGATPDAKRKHGE